jgi:hypothetical protein
MVLDSPPYIDDVKVACEHGGFLPVPYMNRSRPAPHRAKAELLGAYLPDIYGIVSVYAEGEPRVQTGTPCAYVSAEAGYNRFFRRIHNVNACPQPDERNQHTCSKRYTFGTDKFPRLGGFEMKHRLPPVVCY